MPFDGVSSTVSGNGDGGPPALEHAVPGAITHRPSGTVSVRTMSVVVVAYSLVSMSIVQVDNPP